MLKEINLGNQLIIASRFVGGSKINGLSYFRKMMSVGAKFLFKIFYPFKNLNDYTCNFRCYDSQLIKEVFKKKNFLKMKILILLQKY